MSRNVEMVYNPQTKTWTKKVTNNEDTSPSPQPDNTDSNLSATNTDSTTATGSTEQEANTIEINTLQGTLSFIVNDKTIKLKVGDTVNLVGLGKSLSGNYYVKEIKRTINAGGYSHTATVIRTDFGDKLKIVTVQG